jgi:two-component system phosphate regulon response regulator PhoB
MELVERALEDDGYYVTVFKTAVDALASDLSDVRLVIIDAMKQTPSGIDFVVALKGNAATALIPVIILTGSDSEDTIVAAFDAGVDDYVVKPFSIRELLARVKSVMRRYPIGAGERRTTFLTFRSLQVDLLTRQVKEDGMLLPLTRTEFAVLSFLLKNKNQFFNRRQIYAEVWRDDHHSDNERIVDTNISRLRKKLGAVGDCIVNRSGYGYSLLDKDL